MTIFLLFLLFYNLGALINVPIDIQGTMGATNAKWCVPVFYQGQCSEGTIPPPWYLLSRTYTDDHCVILLFVRTRKHITL